MTKDRSIAIANIYHMLSYAYRNLQQRNYQEITAEPFENAQDLFAAILAKGMAVQLKRGLSRSYIEKSEPLSALKGKIDIKKSMQLKMRGNRRLFGRFDELSENHYMNQILKTTALCLISDSGVRRKNKDALKKSVLFLSSVDRLEPSAINWRSLHYHRNNATYRMLMNICYLVLRGLLLTTEDGTHLLATFLDDQQMFQLYERFVLEYYKKHHDEYQPASKQIKWDTEGAIDFLPKMESDIMLSDRASGKKLIIDTKYYKTILPTSFGAEKLRSAHLYQIFTYVKNEDHGRTGLVDGILLYAKTDEEIALNQDYEMGGNRIGVRTLDLNMSFANIRKQLDAIVEQWVKKS